MIVCIAEKPSVARDIARVIGATRSCDGYMEGNGYQVTWTFGHLCTLKEPSDYTDQWKRWSLAALPMLPPKFGIKLIGDRGIEKQLAGIERLMQAADEIINCGDAGQEGELIQRWVIQKARATCPVKRLWISSMTDEAIRDGFKQLRDQHDYEPLYLAGLSRAIGDWILGINATRLYTLKYGRNREILSVGRVQTPTLAMIVNRQRDIENFVPKQSWLLQATASGAVFTADGREPQEDTYTQIEYTRESDAQAALAAVTDQPLVVQSVSKKKGNEAPPRLYDLTSLQVDCNKRYGLTAEQTLSLIQALYEKKITTYPRVDTTFLPDDIYPKCGAFLNGLYKTTFAGQAPYAELVKAIGGKPLKKSKKVFDSKKVTDHHAIIPTGIVPKNLSDNEQKVFDLIARAFIAAFYPDCQFETTTVIAKAADTFFRVNGKVIVNEGWKVVFANNHAEQSNEATTLPPFKKNESYAHSPVLTERWSQPPKPFTEATLLRAMETAGKMVDNEELRDAMKENGIGRPSTRAAIIETLFKRKYIQRERKTIKPTPIGISLVDTIQDQLLKSPELTGQWEKKLRDIENKQYDPQTFINELKQQITSITAQVLQAKG